MASPSALESEDVAAFVELSSDSSSDCEEDVLCLCEGGSFPGHPSPVKFAGRLTHHGEKGKLLLKQDIELLGKCLSQCENELVYCVVSGLKQQQHMHVFPERK